MKEKKAENEKKKTGKKNKLVKAAACIGGCVIAAAVFSSVPGKAAKKSLDDVFKD